MIFRFSIALIALCLTHCLALTASAASDWTGFYALARGKDLAGFKPVSPDLNQVIIAHLQPWEPMKMEVTDGIADDTGAICQPDGIFRYPTFAGSFLWLPGSDRVVIVYNEINTAGVRRIYLKSQAPEASASHLERRLDRALGGRHAGGRFSGLQ